MRTEIIGPPTPCYLPDPARLADAIVSWLAGDRTVFTSAGCALLASVPNHYRRDWARRRARKLVDICRALADGMTVHQAARRHRCGDDIAYRFLRPLYAALAEKTAPVDDDDTGADARG
jgi:hypothetical protein